MIEVDDKTRAEKILQALACGEIPSRLLRETSRTLGTKISRIKK